MRLQIAKLEMSKNIRTRDGAGHFVIKITLPKASDVTPPPPEKKLCGSRRFGKMIKKSLGGRSPPLAPPWRRHWSRTVKRQIKSSLYSRRSSTNLTELIEKLRSVKLDQPD